jgi:PBP1b-binding outer membrane lipoprotein LpoB
MQLLSLLIFFQFALAGCAHAATAPIQPVGCDANPALQAEKSAQLLKLAQEDQADRSGPYDSIDWNKVNPRDLDRRIQVATMLAESCFKIASDYASAAIIYVHLFEQINRRAKTALQVLNKIKLIETSA